ncbi:DUF4232 domain-containing protein [Streptomyces thermolineatus]|uniref:DUF4232 domain-containing protein n=2 Tax=Streptomyces TaxID=1883 RepID=UPI003850D94A
MERWKRRMRTQGLLAAGAVVAALGTTLGAAPAAAAQDTGQRASAVRPAERAVRPCTEREVRVQASPSDEHANVIEMSVTNTARKACTVTGPSITFEGLDGAAMHVPEGQETTHTLHPQDTAYAAMQTIAERDMDQARVVGAISVATSPAYYGTRFEGTVLVYDPLTTRWLSSPAEAESTLLMYAP